MLSLGGLFVQNIIRSKHFLSIDVQCTVNTVFLKARTMDDSSAKAFTNDLDNEATLRILKREITDLKEKLVRTDEDNSQSVDSIREHINRISGRLLYRGRFFKPHKQPLKLIFTKRN